MSAAKHTPGPWQAERVYFSEAMKDDPALRIVSLSANRYIAELSFTAEEDGCHVADVEQMRANARLIAAAPAMLDALQMIFDLYDDHKSVGELASLLYEARCIARNPIAQATGEGA